MHHTEVSPEARGLLVSLGLSIYIAVTCITLFAKRVKIFCIFMLQLGIFDIVKHS